MKRCAAVLIIFLESGCAGPDDLAEEQSALDNFGDCFSDPASCPGPPTGLKTCYAPNTWTNTGWGYSYADFAGQDGANAFSGQNYMYAPYRGKVVTVPAGVTAPAYASLTAPQRKDIVRFMNNLAMVGGTPSSSSYLNAHSVAPLPIKGGYYKWYRTDFNGSTYDYVVYWNADQNCAYLMTNTVEKHGAQINLFAKYQAMGSENGVLGLPTSNPGGDPWGNSWQRFTNGYITNRSTGLNDMTMRAYYVGGTSPEDRAIARRYGDFFDYASNPLRHPLAQDPGCVNSINAGGCGAGKVGRYTKAIGPFNYLHTISARTGATTAYSVGGEIGNKWFAYGPYPWLAPLGWPTSNERCLEVQCKYVFSSFENGHIAWSGGVATIVLGGQVPETPAMLPADEDTFSFTLSRSLQAQAGDPDSDQDGLNDMMEKQLAFLTAPRIFWDEDEAASENQNFVKLRRLDMVQIRPRTGTVSTWSGMQWLSVRFMMEYPLQLETFNPFYKGHIGDSEMIEVRMFNADPDFREWRVGEIVFPPHGGGLMYYGNINVLALRAARLNTAYLWLAADENSHGSWGGSETDSEECKGGGIATHDCFEGGSLAGALAGHYYWWFDASRDIGEPEALRYDSWPLEGRGPTNTIPQIKREGEFAAYIENDTGFGSNREYIRYDKASSQQIDTAKAFCGWRCPRRTSEGQCVPTDPGAINNGYIGNKCDGDAVTFPSGSRYADLFPVGLGVYRNDYVGDFTYQLWGNPNLLPLRSGNVASAKHYAASAFASSEYNASTPARSVIDGDRKGVGWANGGGWSSAGTPSTGAPESVTVVFQGTRTIRRIDLFTLQDHQNTPLDPTPAMTFATWGIRNFQVQYCPVNVACGADNNGWVSLAGVTANDKVWTTYTFPAVATQKIRVRVTAGAGGYARITEIEAWE